MGYGGCKDLKSISARGQFGKQYIYWRSKGEQYRRAYKVPFDPFTPRQLAKRGFFWQAKKYWDSLTPAQKNDYEVRARVIKNYWRGLNYFLSLWLRGDIVQETVRSVQRGSLTCVDGDNDVIITEVAMAKSFFWVSCFAFGSSEGLAKSNGVNGGYLLNSTTIRINAIKGVSAPNPTAYWQVIEFY